MPANYQCVKHGPVEAYSCKTTNRHGNGEKTRLICKLCVAERRKARYAKDPEANRVSVNKWRSEHREDARKIVSKCYEKNKDKYLPKAAARRRETRLACLRAYSADVRCAFCGEQHDQFLCLDHIDGGGTKHRDEVGTGSNFYRWIVENNYPPGFRVLCHNCNFKHGERKQPSVQINIETTYLIENPEKRAEYNSNRQAARVRVKQTVISHYGSKCECCHQSDIDVLSIDHIFRGGRKHREELGINGAEFYQWLVNNNFPEGFRVLCLNCNFALGAYGKCPHTVDPGEPVVLTE